MEKKHIPEGAEPWLINLIELRDRAKMSVRAIADTSALPLRSVDRVFSGETENPGVDTVRRIVKALGGCWAEIFTDTGAVIGGQDLSAATAEISRLNEEVEKLTSLLQIANIDLNVQKDKITTLESEITLLNLRLEYEQKINAVHNYYNKL